MNSILHFTGSDEMNDNRTKLCVLRFCLLYLVCVSVSAFTIINMYNLILFLTNIIIVSCMKNEYNSFLIKSKEYLKRTISN